MIERRAGHLCVTTPMVMANARNLLAEGRAALQEKQETFDFEAVPEADSSALAVMLGWLRSAEARDAGLGQAREAIAALLRESANAKAAARQSDAIEAAEAAA